MIYLLIYKALRTTFGVLYEVGRIQEQHNMNTSEQRLHIYTVGNVKPRSMNQYEYSEYMSRLAWL